MERCLTSLVIIEVKIKTTMSTSHLPGWLKYEIQTTSFGEDVENLET